jgi:hypothetical protein
MNTPVYVLTDRGDYLVQRPDKSKFGFSLCSNDQSWEGGLGIATSWSVVAAKNVPASVRADLEWLLTAD